jgi:uncharacterized membrane protein
LEGVALIGLGMEAWITYWAFFGPERLPERIPIHFDGAGNPNGWGHPRTFLILPLVTLGLYLVITLVAQFPAALNYPVRVTAENRARLERLALEMVTWLKVELVWLFVGIQWFTIDAARSGRGVLPWFFPVGIAVVFLTIGWYLVSMFRAGRG